MDETHLTSGQFDTVVKACRQVFLGKLKDYGTAWRILRIPSITDQVYIKAQRIRSIDAKGTHRIAEGIRPEFIGIVNYSVIALIQMELRAVDASENLPVTEGERLFDHYIREAKQLMLDKNHDYGEAWRNMRLSSLTDIILMKLMRIKQIEDNQGKTFISEGIAANYYDIINYAVFALIKLDYEDT
ncbi:MAG: DUF1599 domain-containing protein [Bacteroidota bacterium]